HDQAARHGTGPRYLSLDDRGPSRADLGREQFGGRRDVSIRFARRRIAAVNGHTAGIFGIIGIAIWQLGRTRRSACLDSCPPERSLSWRLSSIAALGELLPMKRLRKSLHVVLVWITT